MFAQKKPALITFLQESEVRWVSNTGAYSIQKLPANEFRTERFRAYRRGKLLNEHVLFEQAVEQCEAYEGMQ